MIVGITGTRKGPSQLQAARLQRVLHELAPMYEFLHGDCIGVDSYAHKLVLTYQFAPDIRIYPSTLESQRAHSAARTGNDVVVTIERPRDPLVRNQMIVNRCSLLLAVPEHDLEITRSGTWGHRALRQAAEAADHDHPPGRLAEEGESMIYYVVKRLCTFEDAIEVDGYPWAINRLDWPKDADSPQHFLPVFATREAAEGWSEDGKYPIQKIVTIEGNP